MSERLGIRKQGGYCTRYWGIGARIFLDMGTEWLPLAIGIEIDFLCFYGSFYIEIARRKK